MSESSSVNNNDFKFEISRVRRLVKDDYKDNKKDKFIYEYLLKDYQKNYSATSGFYGFFALLDQEKGTRGVITREDINIFLTSKGVQKKNITEDDVIDFLNKVKELNPTEVEKAFSQMNFVDENNDNVVTDDLASLFGLKLVNDRTFKKTVSDENGNIKKGFEIFDLNSDGKFDVMEQGYYKANSDGKKGYNQIQTFLTSLDKAGSPAGNADGVITAKDKQNIYNKIPLELFNKLKTLDLKNEYEKPIITPEILALFENGVAEVKFDDMLNSDGSLKQGFELFDLNNDGKIDDLEKAYFSSGGHPISDDTSKLNIQSLVDALETLDEFGASGIGFKEYRKTDGIIRESDCNNLYKALTSANYLMDTIKNSQEVFPEDVAELYERALKEIRLGERKNVEKDSGIFKKILVGTHVGDFIAADYNSIDKFEIASILLHELTHHVLEKYKKLNVCVVQEVETFYMEYKLYNLVKNEPEYIATKENKRPIQNVYFNAVEDKKTANPNMSEKDLATEAFLYVKYKNSYQNYYEGENYSPEQLRALVQKTNNFVTLK